MNAPTSNIATLNTSTLDRIKTLALCAGVFVLAFVVRAWTNTWLTDFWGDSYHHWLVTRLTMLQGGVYTDYKGLEVVWPPFYHYVSMLPLVLSGRTDIVPLQWMNTFWGALACALVTWLAWRLYAHRIAAFTAGMLLALMTWHIAFSGMNVTEVFSGVLILGMVALVIGSDNHFERSEKSHAGEKSKISRSARNDSEKTFLRPREWLRLAVIFVLAFVMPLTRTDLGVYLAIVTLWLVIQKRYVEGGLVIAGVGLALLGWSEWSYLHTGDFFHWYRQYTQNNLHDWLLLNPVTPNAALTFAEYMNRLSPYVFPALLAGVLTAVSVRSARRRNLWLVTALLAGHSLFLIVGYTRGIVPILTERYLALDLPLAALLMGGWVWLIAKWVSRLGFGVSSPTNPSSLLLPLSSLLVSLVLLATTWLRFQNDIPELEIRRWGIDPEWQVGNFLYAQVQPSEVVLTDAPVAIYRSGKDVMHFVSSVELDKVGDPAAALRQNNVRWIVVQPVSYDAALNYIPTELLQAQKGGTVDGLEYELVWRYDPLKPDIQSQVWHVIQAADAP